MLSIVEVVIKSLTASLSLARRQSKIFLHCSIILWCRIFVRSEPRGYIQDRGTRQKEWEQSVAADVGNLVAELKIREAVFSGSVQFSIW